MKDNIILFLKGMLMGICDLVPGVSGGTIAFITGIYERLINAVKSFSPTLGFNIIKSLFVKDNALKKEIKDGIRKLDLRFLITLFIGIMLSIILGSWLIKYMLNEYYTFTISFFIGLILGSSLVIYNSIKTHHLSNMLFGIIGMVLGINLSFLIPLNLDPTYSYVLLAGFLAISAMFLPGISGAFILLILGVYEFMISVLHNIIDKIGFFIVFLVGAVIGALTISRIVSYLFRKDKCKTLYFLLGLVIGALSIPVKKVIVLNKQFSCSLLFISIIIFLIGFIIVILVNRFANAK